MAQGQTNPYAFRWVAPAAIVLLTLGGILTVDPISQSLDYHILADARSWLGVPNVLNVISNVAFFYVGIVGLKLCMGPDKPVLHATWAAFFLGVTFVCFGSAYYHWHPENAGLVWDRLPMTVAFMALSAAVVAEHIGEPLSRYLVGPAVTIGIGTVLWWQHTDDLRLYIWVQATPLMLVPLLFVLYPARYSHRRYLLYALGLYLVAKSLELYDRELYRLTSDTVSGHTLKHLLAALSTYLIYRMLRRRARLASLPRSH
jgi:hypothetical protein